MITGIGLLATTLRHPGTSTTLLEYRRRLRRGARETHLRVHDVVFPGTRLQRSGNHGAFLFGGRMAIVTLHEAAAPLGMVGLAPPYDV